MTCRPDMSDDGRIASEGFRKTCMPTWAANPAFPVFNRAGVSLRVSLESPLHRRGCLELETAGGNQVIYRYPCYASSLTQPTHDMRMMSARQALGLMPAGTPLLMKSATAP